MGGGELDKVVDVVRLEMRTKVRGVEVETEEVEGEGEKAGLSSDEESVGVPLLR